MTRVVAAIGALVLLAAAIVVGVVIADSRGEEQQVVSPTLAAPSASPSAPMTPAPIDHDHDHPEGGGVVPADPSTVPGARYAEGAGVWAVPCDSEYAAEEIEHGWCLVAGQEPPDQPDVVAAEQTAATFLTQWLQLDTDEGWAARADRLAAFVADDVDLPSIPELTWRTEYERSHDIGFRAIVTQATFGAGSMLPQADGSVEVSFAVEWRVDWTLPGGEQRWQGGLDVWTVTVVDGVVTDVSEPDIFVD